MDLTLINKEKLPVIQEKSISVEAIEEKLIKYPYGCCIVINEDGELCGYIDLRDCKKGRDVVSIYKKGPFFRNVDEILAFPKKNKYILYPIVDECNRLACAYYWRNNYLDIENELLQNLYFLKNNNYCMRHYFTRSKAQNVTLAIYSDINHIKSSIIFAELICEEKDVNFSGIFLLNDTKMNMTENLMNYDINIYYIDSLKEIISHTDILFINDEKFNMLENLNTIKTEEKRCRYMRTAIKAMVDKYFNDYIAIKYKYEYKQKGIDVLTFALPTSRDIDKKDKETSTKACLEYIIKTIGNGNDEKGKRFNDTRHRFVINEISDKQRKYFADINSENFNVISKCRRVIGVPKLYEKTIWLVGPCIVAGLYVEDTDTLGTKLQRIINEYGEKIRVVALPIPNTACRKYFFETLDGLNPVSGDCVVWLDQTFRFIRWDYDCIEEYKQLVKEHGTNLYYDIPVHCGAEAMEMIAQKVFYAVSDNNDKKGMDISKEYKMFIKGQTNKINMGETVRKLG